MNLKENSNIPIYLQIAKLIEDQILTKTIQEEEQVFSTNQLAKLFNINAATALKGLNVLIDENILYKKRGVGMFVRKGATEIVKKKRIKDFHDTYMKNMISEVKKIGISKEELVMMINEWDWSEER
ncbi:MAG: GntR family transcriptional regulator [Epulopiscium sp.]|nr:GntR family transcriptional regulator [Candidatus Epulonipiscium sp.]